MPAKYIDRVVTGRLVPIYNRTRLRRQPSTYTEVLNSYNSGTQVQVVLIREFTETVASEYVQAGDKWGRVTAVNNAVVSQPAWMAEIYLGNKICNAEYSLVTTPPVDPPVPGEKVKILSLTVTAKYADGSSETNEFFPVL